MILITSVANKQVVLSVNDRYELNKRFLSQITLADFTTHVKSNLSIKSKIIINHSTFATKKPLPFDVVEIETRWNNAMKMQQHQWDEKKTNRKITALNI